MKKYMKTLCLGLMLMFSASAMAQNKVVTGTVIDELGEPVIGATVRVEGTKNATVTDFDGNYKIEVPEKGKIVVSYIGYKDAVTTGGQLKLETNSNDLEEVVVVGYGVQKKAHLTGSVGTVDMNEASEITTGSLGATLSGLVNGLSVDDGSKPGERATLSIRDAKSQASLAGYNATTNGSTEPLYVIDGYIYPNDVKVGNERQNLGAEAFSNLDASEVESISVLKDAAAAVYGARAANGVILVTTKKGKLGKPSISYSGSFGITNEVSRPSMLSAYNFGRLYNIIQARDPKNASLNATTQLFQADELEAMKNLDYDLLDKYWKTGYTQKHSVNVSGATDNVSYFGGISYFKQDGNLGNLDYDRWNYRAGIDVKISKWMSANLNVNGDYGKKNSPYISDGGGGDDYYRLLYRPTYYPEYVNGHALLPYGPENSSSATTSRNTYHYDLLQNHNGDFSKNTTSNQTINAGVKFDLGIIKALEGLKVSFTYSKSINNSKTNGYGSNYTLYEMTNRYGSGRHLYSPTSGDVEGYDYLAEANFNPRTQNNGNFLSRQMVRTDNYQMNLTFQYNRKFGLHDIGALFSIEKSEAETEWNLISATEPYEFTNHQYSGIDKTNTVVSGNFSRTESGMLSYIGRVNYSYADRYLVEFLLRSDASTKFAPKNYWGTFPTFSLGWVMSEESWFQNAKALKWIDFLKVRGSYGIAGRDNIAAWQWQSYYNLDANNGSVFGEGTTIASGGVITMNKESAVQNPDVKWSKSYKANIGLDLRFLNQRLNVTYDFYHERNRDILLGFTGTVQSVTGNKSAPYNYGSMNNWGHELSITWRDKIGKDFKYHIGLNTGYSDNKILEQEWATTNLYKAQTYGNRTDVGTWGLQCLGMFRTFHDIDQYFEEHLKNPETGQYGTYLGLTKDEVRPGMLIYKDVRGVYNQETGTYADKDYSITAEDEVQLSTRSSNIYGFTINAGAEYKGITLSLQFAAHWGSYDTVSGAALKAPGTYSTDYFNMPSFWNPDDIFVYEDIYDGKGNLIQKANRNGSLPNPGYSVNTQTSTFWRISGARVQLNRLTLGYNIPKNWIKGIGIQSARVSLTGQNLINFYNPNPDKFFSPLAGSYGSYPNLRKWNIGVNLSF